MGHTSLTSAMWKGSSQEFGHVLLGEHRTMMMMVVVCVLEKEERGVGTGLPLSPSFVVVSDVDL